MRLNKFIASNSSFSRRSADTFIKQGRVTVNGQSAEQGVDITENDVVAIDERVIERRSQTYITIILNKPGGYVCSRKGQGSKTIYELLPTKYRHLNSVGRLDKNSSGLLVLTDDGEMANRLTHPRYEKVKIYQVSLDKPLAPLHQQMISDYGIRLEDGSPSKFQIERVDQTGRDLIITMLEGRNRQIRRTFRALGYDVVRLHRVVFGSYYLEDLETGKYKEAASR